MDSLSWEILAKRQRAEKQGRPLWEMDLGHNSGAWKLLLPQATLLWVEVSGSSNALANCLDHDEDTESPSAGIWVCVSQVPRLVPCECLHPPLCCSAAPGCKWLRLSLWDHPHYCCAVGSGFPYSLLRLWLGSSLPVGYNVGNSMHGRDQGMGAVGGWGWLVPEEVLPTAPTRWLQEEVLTLSTAK